MINTALVEPIGRFVDDVTPGLAEISRVVAGLSGDDERTVVVEAFNLAIACVDADGLHTDEELWGLITAFAPRMDTMLGYATPADVRKAGFVNGKKSWLEVPSMLFDVLVRGDVKLKTRHAWKYYERAMEVAHTIAALDAVPSNMELRAIDRFRTMLLRTMEIGGLSKTGGRPLRTNADGSVGPAAVGDILPGHGEAEAEEEPLPPPRPLEELLAELDDLIGLKAVKAEVRLVTDLIRVQKIRAERNLPVVDQSRHLVFSGNPGTGKTTVARLLAQIFRTLEVVSKGHLVETDRSGLVAGYVGQTAIQTKAVVEKALDGLLLIDEAYALARGDHKDFGQEAIDTLVKMMEDERDRIVVVVAGYTQEMESFINSNPGLRSRFPKTIHFPDYTNDELIEIFESLGKKGKYTLTQEAKDKLREFFEKQTRDKGFGNARLARNLFEAAIAHQASRIVAIEKPTDEDLCTFLPSDIAPEPVV